jgi:protocatechuate 3,4-dioxygenase beta subunit
MLAGRLDRRWSGRARSASYHRAVRKVAVAVALLVIALNMALWWNGRNGRGSSSAPLMIAGQVFDSTGRGVDGARVVITTRRTEEDLVPAPLAAVTAGGGKFRIEVEGEGPWFVTVTNVLNGVALRGSSAGVMAGDEVTVRLAPAEITISGVVRSTRGTAIPGAFVRAIRYRTPQPDEVYEALTSSSGEYAIGLRDEAYQLLIGAPGFQDRESVGAATSRADFALDPGARVEGRVLSGKTGMPAERARVRAVDMGGNRRSWRDPVVVADSSGRFAFGTLSPGEYRFVATHRGFVGVSDRSVVATVDHPVTDAAVTLWPGTTISGTVLDAFGSSISGAQVSVFQEAAQEWGAPELTVSGDKVWISPLLPWDARVHASAPGYLSKSKDAKVSQSSSELDFKLERGASVSGLVLDSAGAPVSGALVSAQTFYGTRPIVEGLARTDTAGRYEITGLNTGRVRIVARRRGVGIAVQANVDVKCGCGSREPVDQRVDLQLHRGIGIQGVVRDASGSAIGGVPVFAARATEEFGFAEDIAVSGPDGRYEFRDLEANDWFVAASRSGREPVLLAGPNALGTRVSVHGSEVGRADLDLPKGGLSISGTVRGPDGPVQGADVFGLSRRAFDDRSHVVQTSADGRFTIPNLENDTWELVVVAPGYSMLDRRAMSSENIAQAGGPPVDLRLHLRGAVEGRVVDDSGRPVSDFVIESGFLYPTIAFHGTSGAFVIDGRSPGRVDLVVKTPDASIGTKNVTLREGETSADVVIPIEEGATLVAKLVDPDTGRPLKAEASVSGAGPFLRASSGADGVVRLKHLPLDRTIWLSILPGGGEGQSDSYSIHIPAAGGTIDVGTLKPSRGSIAFDPDMVRPPFGLSAEWSTSGVAVINQVLPGSLAEKDGIHVGDRISTIDGRTTEGRGALGLRQMLHGHGEPVAVTIRSKSGEERTVTFGGQSH